MFEENGVKMHRNNFEGLKWSEDLPGGKKERDHCLWFSSSLLIVPIKSIKCLEMDLVGLLSMQFFSLLFFVLVLLRVHGTHGATSSTARASLCVSSFWDPFSVFLLQYFCVVTIIL
jgi:hypothetical protein